jgi:hypothetical protein
MINCHRGSQSLHCRCHDLNDTAHQLDVTAETLYEAVAQALATARGHDWVGDIGKGLTAVTVKVRNPEVTHIVKI